MSLAKLRQDYLRFHKLALATRDVDPVYPVYRRLLELVGATEEAGFWLTVCHLTWYDAGSALKAWVELGGPTAHPMPQDRALLRLTEMGLPCATERRGNRDPKQLRANLLSWGEVARGAGGVGAWVNRRASWRGVMEQVEFVHGNGRWASYKAAEMFQKVNGLPLKPLDMGHANSSGPRQGLEVLFPGLPQDNDRVTITKLDAMSAEFVRRLELTGLEAPIEEVETTLCDFHALAGGRYYVGHDIDQMQAQLLRDGAWCEPVMTAFQARGMTLPHAYLGELNGWEGVDAERRKAYRDTGELLER